MSIELITPTPAHAPEIARILFDAFGGVAAKHAHPTDFPTRQLATMVAGMLIHRRDFIGVVAVDSETERVMGSNFVMVGDQIAGVGPITVDPAAQSRGLGRQLMRWAIDASRAKGFENIRLVQEAFNRTSLSLYSDLGFAVREPIVEMSTRPGAAVDGSVRAATLADVAAMDALYRRHAGLSRKTELTLAMEGGFPVLLREQRGQLVGYLVSSIFGHGIAETNEDAIALAQQLGNLSPEGNHFILPLRNATLYQGCLALGMRTEKVMNLMSIGEYRDPTGIWLPSVAY